MFGKTHEEVFARAAWKGKGPLSLETGCRSRGSFITAGQRGSGLRTLGVLPD